MSSVPPPDSEDLRRDARWLAQAYDPASASMRFVALGPDDYRSASFLDDRLFQSGDHSAIDLSAADVASAMAGQREDARWIFHIGHVGSTLIARVLGELADVLAIREPRLLRDLLAIAPDQRAMLAPTVRALYSRGFTPNQVGLVKATSFVSEIAAELLQTSGRALFLTASPRHYIASILAGENSSMELEALAPTRAALMGQRAGTLPAPRHLADLAAVGWACGVTALEAAAQARPDASILWCDFDHFLAERGGHLVRFVEALGLPAAPEDASVLAESPIFKRYSKAMEYDYSAALRAELIADATRHLGSDIDAAVAMLGELAKGSPLLARALERHQEG